MKVIVVTSRDILLDHGAGALLLNGEKEVRELISKLKTSLFEISEAFRKEEENGIKK